MSDNCCSTGTKLLYPCSGASDVGELADRAVRKIWKDGFAQKTCLAGVGGDVPGFVQSAKSADANIVVDGCPLACARKCLERIGVKPISIMLADFGYKKGESPVTPESIDRVAKIVKETADSRILSSTKNESGGCSC